MENNNYEGISVLRSSTGALIGAVTRTGDKWTAIRYDENGQPALTRQFSRQAAAMRFAGR